MLEACDAYAGALAVLAPQRAMGMLTVHEVQTVTDLNTVVDPICTASTPPADPTDADHASERRGDSGHGNLRFAPKERLVTWTPPPSP